MALYDATRPFAAPRGATLFTRILGGIAEWNDTRLTRKALAKLSSHELADIGLDHCDIDVVAEGRRQSR